MDINKQEKIKKFLADKVQNEAVKEVLLSSFLKTRGSYDVQFLAASRIAIDLLDSGFKELNRIGRSEGKPDKDLTQIGL